jgi:phenylpyruvate tautomerase PptA (4-oxalocrotonate tautomerase family)
MPSTHIITGEWARGRETAVVEAVQSAFVAVLKTPEWDRDVVVDLYPASRRIVPTGKSERYTRVEIKLFNGRSMVAKRNLYRSIVANLAALGVPKDEVKILLIEIAAENWGIRGGVPASEVNLGFKVDV